MTLAFNIFLTVASRLLYPYSTDDETSLLMVKTLSTVKEPKRFTELHGEEKRKEGDRGDQEEKRMKRNEDNLKDLWDCQMPQHLNHRSPRRRQKERP